MIWIQTYYAKLALDQSSPFFNKATQQTTAPGSTLKLLSAVAGMMEGVIDDGTYFECTGELLTLVTSAYLIAGISRVMDRLDISRGNRTVL